MNSIYQKIQDLSLSPSYELYHRPSPHNRKIVQYAKKQIYSRVEAALEDPARKIWLHFAEF